VQTGRRGVPRAQAERTRDEPLSDDAVRPGWQRAKVLSVRLSSEELARYAEAVKVSTSALVRGWIPGQLEGRADSPVKTVERIAHKVEQLRRRLAGIADHWGRR
jgi:hypothetical protein